MNNVSQLVTGCVLSIIGGIILANYKTFAKMAIESQKNVDKSMGKKRNYDQFGLTVVPKIVLIIIGASFLIFGGIAILGCLNL